MTLAILCSGQGRQDRGMLDMLAEAPETESIFAAASALLGQNVRTLLCEADDDELHANRTSQILCVTRGLSAAATLLSSPALVAGYSVGEMTAWGVAGFWSPEQTLDLVATRAEMMDAASGPEDRLGFVRGLPRATVEDLVAQHDCSISIVNPNQVFVIGGTRLQVECCCAAALAKGATSSRLIDVYVASHTKRLASAVSPFFKALSAVPLDRARADRTLIGASDASVVRSQRSLRGLADQIATTIDWSAVLEALIERGVTRLLEFGPGGALADMARAVQPKIDARAVDDFRTLDGVKAWLSV